MILLIKQWLFAQSSHMSISSIKGRVYIKFARLIIITIAITVWEYQRIKLASIGR